jgi:hypothetical protein
VSSNPDPPRQHIPSILLGVGRAPKKKGKPSSMEKLSFFFFKALRLPRVGLSGNRKYKDRCRCQTAPRHAHLCSSRERWCKTAEPVSYRLVGCLVCDEADPLFPPSDWAQYVIVHKTGSGTNGRQVLDYISTSAVASRNPTKSVLLYSTAV